MERDYDALKTAVWEHFSHNGRSLPWRQGASPYQVLVSEFMLQQTQVPRVLPKFDSFIGRFPSLEELAQAQLALVLEEWQGLGYNRRARFLHESSRRILAEYGGAIPRAAEALEELPGIGPYTARAISCFAYGSPYAFLETNIKAVFIHFFFSQEEKVDDDLLLQAAEEALDRERPREWNWALMDYGSALKALVVNPTRKSASYRKQSPFEGSLRKLRGAALRYIVREGEATIQALAAAEGVEEERMGYAVASLVRDRLLSEGESEATRGRYRLPK
jgi:A/G-specific adenine glycosylase